MTGNTRREFLRRTAGGVLVASGALAYLWSPRARADKFGELVPDPAGMLDLPEGFSYQILERVGDPMDDGYRVPGLPDGMMCVEGAGGDLVLMRNHELLPGDARSPYNAGQSAPPQAFAPASVGGVTRLVVDAETFERKSSNLVLVGTDRNCAGGLGPGGWLSCEETVDPGHGYVFLCSPEAASVAPALPIPALGRFRHEAAGWDPATGVIYLTEDQPDGCLYRLVPTSPDAPFVGRLQALRITDVDGVNTGTELRLNEVMPCGWVDIDEPDPIGDTVRTEAQSKGAALFVRGEGLHWDAGALYIVTTTGGAAGAGQVFRHVPGEIPADGGTLELIAEAGPDTEMTHPDNVVVAPWGDIYLAEDNLGVNHIRVLDEDGKVHAFARNSLSTSEFAGVCFSPDGRALFVNLWGDGITFVITGPFDGMAPSTGGTDSGKPLPGDARPFEGDATAECACTTDEPGASAGKAVVAAAALASLKPSRPEK